MRKFSKLFLKARVYILIAPTVLWITGASMNQAVLIANGGKFPVIVNDKLANETQTEGLFGGKVDNPFHVDEDGYMDDELHCRMTAETHLNWLADYINLRTGIYSPGDMLLELSEFLAAYSLLVWVTLALKDYSAA